MTIATLFTICAFLGTPALSAPVVQRATHQPPTKGLYVDADVDFKHNAHPAYPGDAFRSGTKVDVDVIANGRQRVDNHHYTPRGFNELYDGLDPFGPISGTKIDADVAAAGQFYGYHLDLDSDALLKCNVVYGLFDGEAHCACKGDNGRFFGLDIEQAMNVPGVSDWLSAEVEAGYESWYPAGARPNCDGKGGYTCPKGVSSLSSL